MAPGQGTEDGGLERDATVRSGPETRGTGDVAPYTDAEIEEFSAKLRAWGDTLPAREQELLARLVRARAGSPSDEVGGHLGDWTSLGASLTPQVQLVAQDVTVNKAKTADKAFNAMDGFIRG